MDQEAATDPTGERIEDAAAGTILTERQVEVLRLREEGRTQREVAEVLGTTASNVSAVERAAQENVTKARRTLELVRLLHAPVRFAVEDGATFDEVVDRIYAVGDDCGIKVDYCKPELYSHLYAQLEAHFENSRLAEPIEIGITEDGDVRTYSDPEP